MELEKKKREIPGVQRALPDCVPVRQPRQESLELARGTQEASKGGEKKFSAGGLGGLVYDKDNEPLRRDRTRHARTSRTCAGL